jgi:hypothetical protein
VKKAIGTTLALASPIAITGAAIHFAPDFMWQFGYNMKLPVTVLTMLVLILSYLTFSNAHDLMKGSAKVSDDYAIGEWRAWTAINVAGVMGLFWLLIQAIPSPTFKKEVIVKQHTQVEVVEKPVEKVVYAGQKLVYRIPTYVDMYDKCIGNVTGSINTDDQSFCHKLATEAALPPYRTRIVYKNNSISGEAYERRFQQCFNQWKIKGITVPQILDMTNTCKAYAKGQ